MKKLFTLLLTAFIMVAFSACNSCQRQTEIPSTVESFISEDTEYMDSNYDSTYVWYETQIVLNDYLDEECDGSFESVINLFQVVSMSIDTTFYDDSIVTDTAYDPFIVRMIHVGDSLEIETEADFVVGDKILNNESICLTYEDAFQRMNEANYPKPHAKNCTLRRPLGPKDINAQYIFGNIISQLYVDAVTGQVLDHDPSFGENVAEETEE